MVCRNCLESEAKKIVSLHDYDDPERTKSWEDWLYYKPSKPSR